MSTVIVSRGESTIAVAEDFGANLNAALEELELAAILLDEAAARNSRLNLETNGSDDCRRRCFMVMSRMKVFDGIIVRTKDFG